MRHRFEQDGCNAMTGSAKMLLIVEHDMSFGSFLVRILLEETPYHCMLASDAVQAQSYMEEVIPDLLVLDYHVPGMDGIELYDRLHALHHLMDVPAIIVSNDLPLEEVQKRHLTGIKKPLEVDGLLEVIGQYMARPLSWKAQTSA